VIRGDEMQKPLGSINHLQELRLPVIKNYTPEAMPQLATELVGSLIKDVPLIILAGHGVYAWGDSPLEALSRVEAVEFLCQSAAF
jgi:methylthioribulose-1-phosphate dehydratase